VKRQAWNACYPFLFGANQQGNPASELDAQIACSLR
jgi:hypothetical protein